jgi:hypothetical protein
MWIYGETGKIGAMVVVQNCACEDESEDVEIYGDRLGSLL